MQEDLRREVEAVWGKPLPPSGSPEEAELVSFLRTHRPDLLEAWYALEEVPEEQERQVQAREASRKVRRALLYEEDENRRPFLSKAKTSNLFLAGVALLVFGVMGVFLYGLYRGGGSSEDRPPPPSETGAVSSAAISPPPAEPVPFPKPETPSTPQPPQPDPAPSVPQPPELPSLEGVPPPPGALPPYVASEATPRPVAVGSPASSEGTAGWVGSSSGEVAAPLASQPFPQPAPAASLPSGVSAVPVVVAAKETGEQPPQVPAVPQAASQAAPDFGALEGALAGMREAVSSPSPSKPDLRPGARVSALLPFDLVLVDGVEVSVPLEAEGALFLGRARVEGGLVRILVDRVLLGDGREAPLAAQAVGPAGEYLVPEVRDLAPALAQDLLRGALGGITSYVEDLRSQRRVVLGQGGTVAVESQAPGLLEQLASGAAQVLRLPQSSTSVVRTYRVPKGTRLTVWVLRVG